MSNITSFVKRLRDIMREDPGINGDAQRIEQIAWTLFLKVYDSKELEWQALDNKYVSIIPEKIQWRNWAHEKKLGDGLSGDELLDFVNNTVFPTLKNLKVNKETEIRKAIVQTTFADAHNYMKDGVCLRQIINVIDEIDFSDYEECHAFGEIYESILKELQSAGTSGEFYTPRAVTEFMARMINPKIGEKMADFACGTGGFITSWLKVLEEKVTTIDDQKKYVDSIYGIEKKQFPYMLCVTNLLLHDVDAPKVFHDNSLVYDVLNYSDEDCVDVVLMNPPYGGSEKQDVKNHFPADLASSETADLFLVLIMYRLKKNGRAAVIIPDGLLFGTDNSKVALKTKLLNEFNLHTIIRLPSSVFSPYTNITTNILFFDNTGKTENVWYYRVDIPKDRKHFSKTKPMLLDHFTDCMNWWNNRVELKDEDDYDKSKKVSLDEIIQNNYDLDYCGYPHKEETILSIEETINNFEELKEASFANLERSIKSIKSVHDNLKNGTETLPYTEQIKQLDFSFLLNIGETMRKSILQEAIQGKLVPQIKSEGNASDLLEEIHKEKQSMIASGKISVDKKLTPITDESIPFDIPESWTWCKLGEIAYYKLGKTPPRAESIWWGNDTETPWISIADMVANGYVEETKEYMSSKAIKECFGGKISPKGTLIMSFKLTIGRVSILNIDAVHNEAIISIFPHCNTDNILRDYLFKILPLISQHGDFKDAIKGQTLNSTSLSNLLIPLPPLAEQKRIIEAIDKLLPLCKTLGD